MVIDSDLRKTIEYVETILDFWYIHVKTHARVLKNINEIILITEP